MPPFCPFGLLRMEREMDDGILVTRGVSKRFFRAGRESAREFAAVDAADIELRGGELIELVGRSGSGKSTLLNMLAGLLAPNDGSVELEGQNLYALGDVALSRLRNERIGVVPQGQTALFDLTVIENVKLPYLMYREDDSRLEERALDLLGQLGIADLADCYPSELSGGEMRRMAVARALVCSPRVLLADEPTGDLDDENTRVVLEVMRKAADEGAAVLLVTHEQAAAEFSDRRLRMDAGHLAPAR